MEARLRFSWVVVDARDGSPQRTFFCHASTPSLNYHTTIHQVEITFGPLRDQWLDFEVDSASNAGVLREHVAARLTESDGAYGDCDYDTLTGSGLINYTSGRRLHWSGISSISEDQAVSMSFARSEGDPESGTGPSGVLFRITARTGRKIQHLSALPAEAEVLINYFCQTSRRSSLGNCTAWGNNTPPYLLSPPITHPKQHGQALQRDN